MTTPKPARAMATGRPLAVMAGLLHEPLVIFLAIGIAIFWLHAAVAPPAPPDRASITLGADEADRLRAQFSATWNRAPTPEEFRNLVMDLVEEEVLYREARAYGLDEGDQVVRTRLRQKAEFLLANPGAIRAPTETELVAHFEATRAIYAVPATLAFRQVFLGEPTPGEMDAALSALRAGADPAGVGRASLLPEDMGLARQTAVDAVFGTGFFARVSALPVGEWTGPVESAFGVHAVRVTAASPPAPLPFAEVRSQVEADWRRAEGERAREAALAAIMAGYRIDLSQIEGLP